MGNQRRDIEVMARLVPQGASVLDIGCGHGELLALLQDAKNVLARGLEIDAARVNSCIAKGLAVTQADAEEELTYYEDKSFDISVLSRAIQAMDDPVEMLKQVTRVGKKAIVSIPNFGFWRNRFYLALQGKMPVTRTLQYQWYNTPNIHFCTIRDFIELCNQLNIHIEKQIYHDVKGKRKSYLGSLALANLLAEQATFLVSSQA